MLTLSEIAYAKINLALHVRKRRDDGYHDLETLFAFADDGDILMGELAEELTLKIIGDFGANLSAVDNLVIRAAEKIRAHFKIEQGALITLDKRLPIASGIGGGSADAAAAARLLNKLWDIGADNQEFETLLASLGADIPACVASRTVLGKGTGTELFAISDDLTGIGVLLVNPGVPMATGPVFAGWFGADEGALPAGSAREIALYGRNDLELSAMEISHTIADVLEIIQASGAFVFRMSGSGATCFGLYNSAAEVLNAQEEIARKRPLWWQMAGSLR